MALGMFGEVLKAFHYYLFVMLGKDGSFHTTIEDQNKLNKAAISIALTRIVVVKKVNKTKEDFGIYREEHL